MTPERTQLVVRAIEGGLIDDLLPDFWREDLGSPHEKEQLAAMRDRVLAATDVAVDFQELWDKDVEINTEAERTIYHAMAERPRR